MAAGLLHPYPAYQPSGVPRLGDVPQHWEVRRLKTLLAEPLKYGANEPASNSDRDLPRYIRITDIRDNGTLRDDSFRSIPADLAAPYLLLSGDILFARSGATVGKTFRYEASWGRAAHAGYLIRARLAQCEALPEFVMYFSQSGDYWDWVNSTSIQATIQNVSAERYSNLTFPTPPLLEQRAIVRYLDHVDERIQRYVDAKQKLIALLEEEKQAVVNRAVTRGLDPNVRLKPSGVDWLGDVPEHWEMQRLKTLADISTGGRDTINRRDDGAYPFFVRSQTVERIGTWSFDGEAVLTAGDGVGVGKVFHYINGKFDYHQRVYKFSKFRDILGTFFFHYFRSTLRNEVFRGTAKSTVDSLRLPMLQNFAVAFPPAHEQRAIAEHVDRATASIDASITRARRQIELLQEYRTRLISDAVTGKLDVREAAAQLPNHPMTEPA